MRVRVRVRAYVQDNVVNFAIAFWVFDFYSYFYHFIGHKIPEAWASYSPEAVRTKQGAFSLIFLRLRHARATPVGRGCGEGKRPS